jgi:transcriptional regulator with XRE-family HTH domain
MVVEPYGSVTSIAAAIGRSEGAVRKWLRGHAEPNATDLRLLSIATGASLDWLIFGGDTPFSASVVKTYLAYMAHQRACEALQREAPGWSELSAARKRIFERRALIELADWVIADATRAAN